MSGGRARFFLDLWRGEGARAMAARVADHWAAAQRRRRFRRVALHELPPVPVLQVAASPPHPWLGGVAAQLLDRVLEQEQREVTALLFPWRHGMRLEVVAGGRRWWAKLPYRASSTPLREDPAFADAQQFLDELGGS